MLVDLSTVWIFFFGGGGVVVGEMYRIQTKQQDKMQYCVGFETIDMALQ